MPGYNGGIGGDIGDDNANTSSGTSGSGGDNAGFGADGNGEQSLDLYGLMENADPVNVFGAGPLTGPEAAQMRIGSTSPTRDLNTLESGVLGIAKKGVQQAMSMTGAVLGSPLGPAGSVVGGLLGRKVAGSITQDGYQGFTPGNTHMGNEPGEVYLDDAGLATTPYIDTNTNSEQVGYV